ncbi:hypothetical protein [Aphanizomenon flos-aquae]|uniref:Uncharacterized protein n=1 Tax=Aphanizomenon flos-aquae FACHB-1040 TaxID=2692887 RepID=A0ABR8BXF4_APHFL|nr:hypothetical protein [Aphanizomenon flos-aquae]MBD2279613.1 hypothetical protein [Aphanizomenon flos-aquae FACHB-1040]
MICDGNIFLVPPLITKEGNREQGANKKLYKCFIGIAIALLIPKSDRFFAEGWAIIAPFMIFYEKIIETLALTGFEGLISSKISDSYGALRYRS